MAGLFQVFWGTAEGAFETAAILKGTDGEPLIIPGGKDRMTDKICTRPTAVDLNGDGKLDIVSGNFEGSFAFFVGKGEGRFSPRSKMLTADGDRIRVAAHSDPFFVDWDSDGDFDLISGSAEGGVFLFVNHGTAKQPKFRGSETLVPAIGYQYGETKMGDSHITGPQTATRVWVDDINGDGMLDLLVGDSVTLSYPEEGFDEVSALAKLAVWKKKEAELLAASSQFSGGAGSAAKQKKFQEDYTILRKEREKFIRAEMTGFVWVFYQKSEDQK